ncbi:uncharacterized protein C2845_PM05G19540 [Panicum miliaceum]|uniref:SOSEKI DIX-like domain-containing protein n=1 Tax=Panicum miliaceum TaxID=4540 RepID=A0A3L6T420_PANMI|nr:uncharacterized protein C2845_PM05G19540 [Panicum miliaceum]
MAASSSSFQRGGERRGRWGSPERTVVWAEPKPAPKPTRKVAVVYYLCHRDGHLDHPHFLEMELPLSSSSNRAAIAGLYLRDFTARLDALRGSGMPAMYAWSSKRSYRNGYVWQDLAEDDLVHPAHGTDEYVLKGSPLILFPQPPPPARRDASSASSASSSGHNTRAGRRRKNWSSFDLGEYSNNKQLVALRAAQQSAATQTDHRGLDQESTELAIDEISPPPSSSSPDVLDSCGRDVGVIAGGRMRASAVLMQLFSCGFMGATKRGHAFGRSDVAPMSASGSNRQAAEKEADAYASAAGAECSSGGGVGVGNIMERDYFSGSLVESRKTTGGGGGDAALLLKRSSSCNADRGAARLKLPVAEREHVVRAGCLASRGSRAPKRNTSKSAAAASRDDGGECKGATEPAAAADGAGSS